MRALLRTNCFRPMSGLDRNFRVRMVGAAMVKLNSRGACGPCSARAAECFVAVAENRESHVLIAAIFSGAARIDWGF